MVHACGHQGEAARSERPIFLCIVDELVSHPEAERAGDDNAAS